MFVDLKEYTQIKSREDASLLRLATRTGLVLCLHVNSGLFKVTKTTTVGRLVKRAFNTNLLSPSWQEFCASKPSELRWYVRVFNLQTDMNIEHGNIVRKLQDAKAMFGTSEFDNGNVNQLDKPYSVFAYIHEETKHAYIKTTIQNEATEKKASLNYLIQLLGKWAIPLDGEMDAVAQRVRTHRPLPSQFTLQLLEVDIDNRLNPKKVTVHEHSNAFREKGYVILNDRTDGRKKRRR